jgi:hypothetical protein
LEGFSSEEFVDFQYNTRHHIPEDVTLHNHLCENLTSCMQRYIFLVQYSEVDLVSYLSNFWEHCQAQQHPEWKDIGDRSLRYKGYWAQWMSLAVKYTILECHWKSPYGRTEVGQSHPLV